MLPTIDHHWALSLMQNQQIAASPSNNPFLARHDDAQRTGSRYRSSRAMPEVLDQTTFIRAFDLGKAMHIKHQKFSQELDTLM